MPRPVERSVTSTDTSEEADDATATDTSEEVDDVTSTDAPEEVDEDTGPNLTGRIVVTWFELTLIATIGGALAGMVGGIPQIVVYTFTTIVSVAVLFYNINELIKDHVAAVA